MKTPPALASELVQIPSVNPMDGHVQAPFSGMDPGEARLTLYLEDYFREHEIPCERQESIPGRENIVAYVEVPGSRRTLLLDAHQDTVPVDSMTIPPFSGEIRGGRLWGRGACDVKGGMAAVLFAAARIAAEKPRGAASVIVACTVDEEHTFRGVQRLLAGPWRGTRPDMAVVVEPTRLDVVIAHKGLMRWRIAVRGRSCHSANPWLGVNAIYRAAPVISALEEYAGGLEAGVTHPLLGCSTLSIGTINGGTSVNVVPSLCRLDVDGRLLPGESPADAFKRCQSALLSRVGADFPVEFEEPWLAEPALETPADAAVTRTAMESVSAVLGSARAIGVPYGTDASTISVGGIPAVVLGPGDIAQAHTEDEWIEIDQIEKASEIFYRLIMLAGKDG